MKSKLTALVLLAALLVVACRRPHSGTSIVVNDDGSSFNLKARYPGDKTGRVGRFINRSVGPDRHFAFKDGKIDATAILEDDTKFRVRLRPGRLDIQFDKSENSDESYFRMVKIYEGIKGVLTDPE